MRCWINSILFLVFAGFLSVAARAQQVVHVDGVQNASIDASNAVRVTLAAGSYSLAFTSGSNSAFNRFGGVSGCDANGENCVQGYETAVWYRVSGTTYLLGAGGGYGPINPGNGYYSTPEKAIANANSFTATINIPQATTVDFYLNDDNVGDNSGGVNIAISPAQLSETTVYGYDALGRLTSVSASGGRNNTSSKYMFDKAGNRVNVQVITSPR